jgi:hypothetical protein
MADPALKSEDDENAAEKQARRLIASVTASPRRDIAAATPPAPSATAKVYQLPLWPEPVRGAPNSFLRSALFAAIQGKGRKQMKHELLASMQGITVRYTGEQLDQSDLDVWEQMVHLARQHPLGNICHFTGYGFLKALGRGSGNSQYQWLESVFRRLTACAVVIDTKRKQYGGNLLAHWEQDKDTRSFRLTLNPKTVALYGWNDWTAIDWEQRQMLQGKPLALWLHGFYSSHANPHSLKVETIQQLSGSATKNPRHFKANLKTALADLEAATGIKGTIEDDLVTVERHGSRAQLRHLRRRSAQHEAIHGKHRRRGKGWQQIGNLI